MAWRLMVKRVKEHLSGRTTTAAPTVDPRQLALEMLEQLRAVALPIGRTFGDLAREWLAANKARLVCPENERRHIDHLRAVWDLREGSLTPSAIVSAIAALGIGNATKNKVRSTGRRIIQAAMADGTWRLPNPFALVKPLRQTDPTHRLLTMEEISRVLPHLRPDRRRLVRCALFLGARPGELLGLRRADVNLEARTISIHRSHGRDSTKTGRSRTIPIPAEILPDLTEALAEGQPDAFAPPTVELRPVPKLRGDTRTKNRTCVPPSEWVFPDKNGQRQRADTKLAKILRTAIGKAGIASSWRHSCRRQGCGFVEERSTNVQEECPRCGFRLWVQPIPIRTRFYDLRHAAATHHRAAGADPLAISLVLGHAVRDTTGSIYTHLTPGDLLREMDRLKTPEPSQMDLGRSADAPQAWEARALPTELPPRDNGPSIKPRPLMDVKAVAERLGALECKVYALNRAGDIPSVRLGNLIRFRYEDVEAFIARGGSRR